jgi:dihydrofolate reductase
MAKLIYSAITSLDGYVADVDGNFDWAAPDDEVHAFVNDLERPIGTYLYGRRMYDTMRYWESPPGDLNAVGLDFAQIWQRADKVVFSKTLEAATTARTRVERKFGPDVVRNLKSVSDRDIGIGGSDLAGQAIEAGIVDEIHLFLGPVLIGGGKSALPAGVRVKLELLDEHRFSAGVVHLRYGVVPDP